MTSYLIYFIYLSVIYLSIAVYGNLSGGARKEGGRWRRIHTKSRQLKLILIDYGKEYVGGDIGDTMGPTLIV